MLNTFVIVALQDSWKVLVFFWPTDCVSLRRGWPFLSFWPIIISFFPRAVIRDIFICCSWWGFFRFFFLVPWMLVDIRLVYIYIYIYIFIYIYLYIYMCVCVCVCVCVLFGPVKTELGVIHSGQENHSRAEHLNFPGRKLNVIDFTEQYYKIK